MMALGILIGIALGMVGITLIYHYLLVSGGKKSKAWNDETLEVLKEKNIILERIAYGVEAIYEATRNQ